MTEATIIFPNQLFTPHPAIEQTRPIYLVECDRYFTDFNFHKKKLLLHRASMQNYCRNILKEGYDVHYINFQKYKTTEVFLGEQVKEHQLSKIHLVELVDHKLSNALKTMTAKYKIELVTYESPAFLSPKKWLASFFEEKNNYRMTSFYIAQRKRLNILVENDKPVEGKWSFDKDNREKLPKSLGIPKIKKFQHNKEIEEAANYIEKHFPNNPGDIKDFFYPINQTEALIWLDDFLENRLNYFGNYEDAISAEQDILFHSVLSPLLNIGLLTPEQVIEQTLEHTKEHPIRFNSLEGFIRQIIGWREFIRAIYLFEGEFQRTANYWHFSKKIPRAFYKGKTGILPVDNVLQKIKKNAYCHHIERLMVLGNFLLLNEIAPKEVYRWFMEMFIDAYDWVMIPNVYGMSQYADGGLMATKPYISSSNYLLKMSDFPKGKWCKVFDALYWNFIEKQKEKLQENPRMRLMLNILEKKGKEEMDELITTAQEFMQAFE